MASHSITHKKRPTRHSRKGSRKGSNKSIRYKHSTKRRMRKSAPYQSIFSNLFKGGDASTHAINVYGGTDDQHLGTNGSIAQIQSSYLPPVQNGGKIRRKNQTRSLRKR
jgi:hypothetical protein